MLRYVAYGFINLFFLAVVLWSLLFLGTYINGFLVGNKLPLLAMLLLIEAIILNTIFYALNRWFVTIITAMQDELGTAWRTAIVGFLLSIGFVILKITH